MSVGLGSRLRFDLFQDTLWPYAPSPANYAASFLRKLTAADGQAWTGLFDSSSGDQNFSTLNFGALTRSGAPALVLDWNPAGDAVSIVSRLAWNDIKNVVVDDFTGASLTIRNLVDALVDLRANTAGQGVTVDGAKRAKIDLGSGHDTLFIGADSNKGGIGNDFHVNTGAGDDSVTITRSTIDYSITAFRFAYVESWTNSFVDLGEGNDSIIADGSNDTVRGGAGADRAELRGGTNSFDGGADFDTAVFRGLRADYRIEALADGLRITDLNLLADGNDGVTTLTGVERLQFRDLYINTANRGPVATDDAATATLGVATVTLADLLANDSDPDGDALSLVTFTNGANGAVVFGGGSFVYTAGSGFTGSDSFTYTISDGQGGSATATVTVTAPGTANRAPVVLGESFSVQEDRALRLDAPGLLANDSDADGDALTVSGFTQGANGQVTVGADGALVYRPFFDFVGTDSFTYTVTDGIASSIGTVEVTVVEGDPIAVNDLLTTRHGTALFIPGATLLANDSDPNGDALRVVSGDSTGTQGRVQILTNGDFIFTPNAGFTGTTSFMYGISDGPNRGRATVTVEVTNAAPVAQGESLSVSENGVLALAAPGLLANDSDADGDALTVSGFTQGANGQVTIGADGALTYQPFFDFVGNDRFTYTVTDGIASSTATVEVTVVEGDPIARLDEVIAFRDTALFIPASRLLANDTDPNGDALRIVGGDSTGTQGRVEIRFGGDFVFTPSAGFTGTTSFRYNVTDGVNSAQGTVNVTVRPPNTVDAVDDRYAFTGPQLSVNAASGILANDRDADGDAFSVVGLDYTSAGQLFMADDGTFLYVPAAGFLGTETFTYTIRDAFGAEDTATVQLTVTDGNLAPIGVGDSYTIHWRDVLSVAAPGVLANDSDPNGDRVTVSSFGEAANGFADFRSTGLMTYTPNAGFLGTDSFFYRPFDGRLEGNDTTVTVTVTNTRPVAGNDGFSVQEGRVLTIAAPGLLANDSDADGDAIIAANFSQGANGAVTMVTDGSFTYTPNAGFSGVDSFTYRIFDGIQYSADATVTVTVISTNRAPIARPDVVTIQENTSWTSTFLVPVLGNDEDPDGQALSLVSVDTTGTPIAASVFGNQVRFNVNDPAANTNGVFTIGYTVTDGTTTASSTLTITVLAENDAPFDPEGDDAALGLTTAEDSPLAISIAALLADELNPPDEVQSASLFDLWQGAGGTVTDNGDGTLTFTPSADFHGDAYFYYRAVDEQGAVSQLLTIVPVTVTSVNDPVTANDDAIPRDFAAGGTQTITRAQLLGNDIDPDANAVISAVAALSGGTSVVLNADQSVTVTYAAGEMPVFTYTLSDGTNSSTATVSLNTGPQVTGQAGVLTLIEDQQAFLTDDALIALAGVTDPDGDNLFISFYGTNPHVTVQDWFFESAYYTSGPLDWNGPTTLSFTISDGNTATDLAVSIDVVVTPVNDGPRDTLAASNGQAGADGVFVGTEEVAMVISKAALMADDIDPEGGAVSWHGAIGVFGSITDNGDTITFTPYANYAGELGGFFYYVQDAQGVLSSPIGVYLNLANVADPIVANDDLVARTAGATQAIAAATMLGNDTDADAGDTKAIIDLVANNGISSVGLDASGDVVVQYAAGSTGRASFTYTVQDSTGNTDTATVTLNRAPVAAADGTFTMSEGPDWYFIPYGALLANDSDADGDALSVVPWNWGYAGSNVSISSGWFQGGELGLRVFLLQDEYTGPAQFTYLAWDGSTYSEQVVVTLNVVAGDDPPVANTDYWYYNGATHGDVNPATNDMVGTEDGGPIIFPVSRLVQGQSTADGAYTGVGADRDDDTPLSSLDIHDISSFYGTVEIIDVGGVGHVRFTPFENVSSSAPWGGLDWTQVRIEYSLTDGTSVSNAALAYVLVLPVDDVPVAVDDIFQVSGSGPHVLDIVAQGGQYDVRANDSVPDAHPFSRYDYSSVTSVLAVSGGTVSWNGSTVTFTPDGSGDPMVFEYALTDYDGDVAFAQVTLQAAAPAAQLFYFSGATPGLGRELWSYDPNASLSGPGGDPFATMVDEAEGQAGADSGNPREITALAGTAFWRGTTAVDFSETTVLDDVWQAYNPDDGHAVLRLWDPFGEPARVAYNAFDSSLPQDQQNLGVRSGELFWGATFLEGEALTAWTDAGQQAFTVFLPGTDRTLLTDAGGNPAYAALAETYDIETEQLFLAEQLFVVLPDPDGGFWQAVQATDGGDAANDIAEIAGLAVQVNPDTFADAGHAKTLYFAGDFTDQGDTFRSDALWKVTLVADQSGWSFLQAPEWIDNGSSGAVEANPHALTVARVLVDADFDAATGPVLAERLFYFATDAAGQGQIATRFDNWFGGTAGSTGSGYQGFAFQGLQIRPIADGVAFSGIADAAGTASPFVATWTDADGNGFFDMRSIYDGDPGGMIEHLVVDDAGTIAFVHDGGDHDTLFVHDGTALSVIVQLLGEIDELQLGDGHLVYREVAGGTGMSTLFDHVIATGALTEVPTDEALDGGGTDDGFLGSYANVAIPGALVFQANLGVNQGGMRMLVTNGQDVFLPAQGLIRDSEGAVLNGQAVFTGYRSDTADIGLFGIDATGGVTSLYTISANVSNEAEVLGQQVVFGTTSAIVNQVKVFDATMATTSVLLNNAVLGAAATVGGNIIFSALDLSRVVNADIDTADDVWTLYAYDGSTVSTLVDLPTGGGGFQHVHEWWRHQDFLGDDSRIFWRQATETSGVEVFTIDLAAANPGTTLAMIEVAPGNLGGANFSDAVFANGRLYFQGSVSGLSDQMRLYTTNGSDLFEVTGTDLFDAGQQFPYLPVALGGEVFFLGRKGTDGNWGVFQVNDDGVTAALITPGLSSSIYALAAVGTQLMFLANDTASNTDQVYAITPGATPVPATLTQLTALPAINGAGSMDDLFLGGDGNIYFGRGEPATGRELWVLDATQASGARLVDDINREGAPSQGYAPEQVVAVPNPLEAMLAGMATRFAGGFE